MCNGLGRHGSKLVKECEVSVPNLVTSDNQTSIFEWYEVRCGSKNGYQKDMYLQGIGHHAQNMVTTLSSVVNMIGGTYNKHNSLHFDSE